MRVAVAVLVVAGLLDSAPLAGQPAAGAPRVKACPLLTRDLVTRITPYEKDALKLVLMIPAEEEPIGVAGSSCSYGGIFLQVDPFASPQRVEADLARQWAREPGLGDVAYFRDNRGEWAELYVRAGGRVITIQMDIPTGKTAAAIKPNTIALGKAVIAGLK